MAEDTVNAVDSVGVNGQGVKFLVDAFFERIDKLQERLEKMTDLNSFHYSEYLRVEKENKVLKKRIKELEGK